MRKPISLFLCFVMIFGFSMQIFAIDNNMVNTLVSDVGNYLSKTVPTPQVGSVGGEWLILGLARSGADIPTKYFDAYYKAVTEYVVKRKGILHEKKYTEYSRLIIALTSIGKNPENIAGYNLLSPLGDYEKTVWQGINGSIWALIALDSVNYEMPQNINAKVQATREIYINHILEKQTSDGGWALSGDVADPDITAMALQALSKYQDNADVKSATEKALNCMSQKQNADGGFSCWNTENAESSAQMIVALCELGIDIDDTRFVKNGNTMLDNLLSYYINGKGFKHTADDTDTNQMATEQCFYALVALKRANENKSSLYRMSDVKTFTDNISSVGLANKHADVAKIPVVNPDKTFTDIQGHANQTAIESLAIRNIINGKTEAKFEPDNTMTRAEFATIIVRGLGLPLKNAAIFGDVTSNDWFYSYVSTAYSYAIIKGISENEFNPNGMITRAEAAVMVARAAKLCGMDTELTTFEIRNILAVFSDYVKVADWSTNALSFCYSEGILSDEALKINPSEAMTRAQIADMLYNMLSKAKLL